MSSIDAKITTEYNNLIAIGRITYFLIFLIWAFPALSVNIQTYIYEELKKERKEYREKMYKIV